MLDLDGRVPEWVLWILCGNHGKHWKQREVAEAVVGGGGLWACSMVIKVEGAQAGETSVSSERASILV